MTFHNTDELSQYSESKKEYKNECLHFVYLLASVSQDVPRGVVSTEIYFEEMSHEQMKGRITSNKWKNKCVKINIPPDVDINMKLIFLILLFHI